MTALLTDEEIRQFVIVFARDWKTRTGKNSRHVRIEFAVAAAAHVLSAQEARLAEAISLMKEAAPAIDTISFALSERFDRFLAIYTKEGKP